MRGQQFYHDFNYNFIFNYFDEFFMHSPNTSRLFLFIPRLYLESFYIFFYQFLCSIIDSSLPVYMRWVRYFSWLLYSTEALTIIQWKGVHNICKLLPGVNIHIFFFTRCNVQRSLCCKQPAKQSGYPA